MQATFWMANGIRRQKVLIVGGGMVGCEVADFLGELGHEVSVIELRDQLGPDVIPEHRKFLMKDFEAYKVQGVTGAKVAQFFTDGVSYTLADGTEGRLEGFDNVVLAMGIHAITIPSARKSKKSLRRPMSSVTQ